MKKSTKKRDNEEIKRWYSMRLVNKMFGVIIYKIMKKTKLSSHMIYHSHHEYDLQKIKFMVNVLKFKQRFCERALYATCKNGNMDIFNFLIKRGILPYSKDNECIISASRNGRMEIVNELLKNENVDPSARDNKSIITASKNGHYDVVKRLLQDKRVNPSAKYNIAACHAFNYNHFKIVDLLISHPRYIERPYTFNSEKYIRKRSRDATLSM